MRVNHSESVPLNNGTDGLHKRHDGFSSQTPNNPLQAPHGYWPALLAGVTHRAVHPLWKARMQLRQYRRPRSEVLPLGQLPRPSARTTVRVAALHRSGQTVPRQLPHRKTAPRGDFDDQLGIAEAQRQVVEIVNGRLAGDLHVDRPRGVCTHRGKYAQRAARQGVEPRPDHGGKR